MALQVVEVTERLLREGLEAPHLHYLSPEARFVRVLLYQPKGVISANERGIGVADREGLITRMQGFLTTAHDEQAALAACPEYSCPWPALEESLQRGQFPLAGNLWAIGCESISRDAFEAVRQRLAPDFQILIDENVFARPGSYINPLCLLFKTMSTGGVESNVILIQTKTQPMGGNPVENEHLQTGEKIYRLTCPDEEGNSLVFLLCSDTLHANFDQIVAPRIRYKTLVVHLQLNPHPEHPQFQSYTTNCCSWEPRNVEVIWLNWARGTSTPTDKGNRPLVEEPKTILFRGTDALDSTDKTIQENHQLGCYLTYWRKLRTAAFMFSPDEAIFHFETTKPHVMGKAAVSRRTGPKMLTTLLWDVTHTTWRPAANVDDSAIAYWSAGQPKVSKVLNSQLAAPLAGERLIQLSTGAATTQGWHQWNCMDSFQLEDDITPRRLTVCWNQIGRGSSFRDGQRRLFVSFCDLVDNKTSFSPRLREFAENDAEVCFKPNLPAKSLRNLHLKGGVRYKSATAIYLGENPSTAELERAWSRIEAGLNATDSDIDLVAIWYRDDRGTHDFMDEIIPKINRDPRSSSISIDGAD